MKTSRLKGYPIYTLTPNPALDLWGHVAQITPNEKNYVFAERRDPGGNGINAARVIHRLGGRVTALGFLGGSVGAEIERLLDHEGVLLTLPRSRAKPVSTSRPPMTPIICKLG